MIDPLLTSLFLLVLEARWLLRAVEVDPQQNRRWPIPKFAPPSSGKHNEGRII
jgi:hypothetical protein